MPDVKNKGGKMVSLIYHDVVNLTNHYIGFYDAEGAIVVVRPGYSSNKMFHLDPYTMVIVDNESVALAYGIPEENAVHVCSYGIGRDGVRVSRLARIKDDVPVDYRKTPYYL